MRAVQGKRGPAENPYRADDSRWYPGSDDDGLWRAAIPLWWPHDPVYNQEAQLAHLVWLLVERIDAPIPRRFISTLAEHVWKVEPALVRRVLDDFKRHNPAVVYDTIKPDDASDGVTYGMRPLTDKERNCLQALVAVKKRYLSADVLGKAGERYVRAHFIRCSRYNQVTRESKLGYLSARMARTDSI